MVSVVPMRLLCGNTHIGSCETVLRFGLQFKYYLISSLSINNKNKLWNVKRFPSSIIK